MDKEGKNNGSDSQNIVVVVFIVFKTSFIDI